MPPSCDVLFASSNKNKFTEAREILAASGISLGFFRCRLVEIQSDKLEEIAAQKALDAFAKCTRPVIIEDDGLFVDALGGFPGPYSSFVSDTIGNAGLLKLLGSRRAASFRSVIAYRDSKIKKIFTGEVRGRIPYHPRGGGWGYDPVFVPAGRSTTFGEVSDKNKISHRHGALSKFASWFSHR